jgi:diadenosine tetraphosphate (Ap4A) HIT family hydrolase
MACEFCDGVGGELIHDAGLYRVIAVLGDEGRSYPGFCRVIWTAHVKEMSDLTIAERARFMEAVFAVEAALRAALSPQKMNLASLGNLTPHLHWHVIPRLAGDPAFPKPVWAHSLAPLAQDQGTAVRLEAPEPNGMAAWKDQVRRAVAAL